jgi:hypothetical protein
MQWMHTHSLNKLKQKADDNCFLEQEKSSDGEVM